MMLWSGREDPSRFSEDHRLKPRRYCELSRAETGDGGIDQSTILGLVRRGGAARGPPLKISRDLADGPLMFVSAYGGASAYTRPVTPSSADAPSAGSAPALEQRPFVGIDAPMDVVELSPEALARSEQGTAEDPTEAKGLPGARETPEGGEESEDTTELSETDREMVRELKARDGEVRRHENAHAAAGGQYAGSPRYDFQTGPDGRRYAVGGTVSIDVSAVPGEPEKTVEKMRIVRAAALAPAEPSGQDRRVAAEASKTEAAARAELAEQKTAEQGTKTSENGEQEPATMEEGETPARTSGTTGVTGTRNLARARQAVRSYQASRSGGGAARGSLLRASA